ncbi:MAG: DNA translocase FtsK 4TM domain-containing protein [Patescibacteria group bacterium]|nr:DNA translocase FtsK 4TM domain-containing protein [Patescibacteria group bacterium]
MVKKKKTGIKNKKSKQKRQNDFIQDFTLGQEIWQGILVIFLFMTGLISLLALINQGGRAGIYIDAFLRLILGWGAWMVPMVLIGVSLLLLKKTHLKPHNYLGLLIFILAMSGILESFIQYERMQSLLNEGMGGGYLGFFAVYPLRQISSLWVTLAVFIGLLIVSILVIFNISLHELLDRIKYSWYGFNQLWQRFKIDRQVDQEEKIYQQQKQINQENNQADVIQTDNADSLSEKSKNILQETVQVLTRKERKYPKKDFYFSIDLLDNLNEKALSKGDVEANKIIIKRTLGNFNIDVEMGDFKVGPTVTQYTLRPSEGVKLSQITTLHNDLALALAAHPIRIEAPIPGKSLVGIEVPNQDVARVGLREILENDDFKYRKSNLTICLGKDVAGHPWTANLAKMPHLLVAGATGTGKTVCLNTIILSLLYQNSPDDLKLILVDPKRVELVDYNDIPYLITPVITNVEKTVNALKWAILEMERRFEKLAQARKRDIESYNNDNEEKMPYIVIVIDELADLMAAAGVEVEACIIRLAQMARAVGIHLIMATQRPSVDVITGLIKANVTSRIALSVASKVDSRTILDTSGAEKLLGRGDMLYLSAELSNPKRLQGAYISDLEIKKIVNSLKEKGDPDYIEEVVERPNQTSSYLPGENDQSDDLLPQAKEVVIQAQKASASLLQRRLRVGYARAARLLDLLEEESVIGPPMGSKPRDVLIGKEEMDGYLAADEYIANHQDENIEETEEDDGEEYYEE